ncbi:MAG TPA: VCBS repeat-containing protein [Blastocatellia bacterium]|nr:VCBS repeat-containing protein [Blastocatellia bacterium]
MSGAIYCSRLKRLLVGTFLISFLVLGVLALEVGVSRRHISLGMGADFNPYKYLPSGAKIKDQHKDVVFADLDGDGQQEVVIFYTLGNDHKANILVLKPNDTDYVRLWENTYDSNWGFADPTGVYDLNKSGRPQIIAYRVVGASCPGSLEIYEYHDGRIERLTGKWGNNKGHCEAIEVKDLDNDGVPEIVILGSRGANDDIYRWNGRRYVRSNARFSQHYNEQLEKLLQAIYSRDSVPASARINWAIQVIQIYIIQKRYDEAIRLCQDVLQMLDDSSITQPDSVYPGTKGEAAIFKLLGDIYKASGNMQQAQKQYQKARNLEQPPNR